MAAAEVRDVPEGNTIEAVTRRLAKELLTYRGSMGPIPAGITIETVQNATHALARLAVTRIHAMLDEKIAALDIPSAEFYNSIAEATIPNSNPPALILPAPDNFAEWEEIYVGTAPRLQEGYARVVYNWLIGIPPAGEVGIPQAQRPVKPAALADIQIEPQKLRDLMVRLATSPPTIEEDKRQYYSAIRKMHLIQIYDMYRAPRQQGRGRRTTRRRSRRSSHVTFSDQV
jgi:hypothetical protein